MDWGRVSDGLGAMDWAAMDWEVIYVFGVLALTVLLFVGDWLRPDLVAVIALVALELAGILSVEQALAGFASEAVIAIGSLLVIGEGLVQAGVVRRVANVLCRLAGTSPTRLLLVSTFWPGLLSGFINIVAAVSVFIPAVRRLASFGQISPSRLLMPMAATALLGANLSLIGASHNLVVNDLMVEAGLPPLGFFEISLIGAVLVPIAVIYSLLFARLLLPERAPAQSNRPDNWSSSSDRNTSSSDPNPSSSEQTPRRATRGQAIAASAIFALVILAAASGQVSVAIAALAGAGAMVLFRVLSATQVYQAIDGRTLVLIAAMLPMGTALETTGAAQQLAQLLTQALGFAGPVVVMTALGALSMLLTQPLHNAAVAVVMTPTAITAAEAMGAEPRPFAIAVLVGASASFLLPTGHPAPLLTQAPGAYRTGDYLRFGLGLALLTLAVIAVIIPRIWPLEGA